ncbi:unnamed protein product [Mycena citricolor]|uniref:endo-polygalacturonase n=1 Tax=Mycena citricolor TaxID=2018698 RepID=A0AAD2Q1K2_9AGAR|nr:unnamed protein product [Mycena citricolor]
MFSPATFLQLAALVSVAAAAPSNVTRTTTAKRATCTVNSVSSASNLKSCTDVIIEGFTVPSGHTLNIEAASGASVTLAGDLVFAKTSSAGPLITFNTNNINFNGGDHNINGNGAAYWDGKGTNGGSTKPHPFVKFVFSHIILHTARAHSGRRFKGSGTFSFVTVLNSPAQAISVGTSGATVIERVTVDNSAGASLGHNTDGFDVSASDVTIAQCTVINQDDCVAVNKGNNILVEDTTCTGSHGISIGSIASGHAVTNFKAARNTITGGLYGLRIKVDANAKNAQVSGVTYEANVVSGISDYGVLITQSYPANDGTPGTGGPISNVAFIGGTTTVAVDSGAMSVVIDCGACSGNWDFSGLDVTSAGKGHKIAANNAKISGGHY